MIRRANVNGGTTVVGTLALSGAGTLGNINNAVAVTGGTLDLGGTTQTQNGNVVLTGGLIINGKLSSNGSFDLRSGSASAILAGVGSVDKTTAGTVTLSSANTYSGITTVNDGTLALSGTGTLGNTGNYLRVFGGTIDLGGTTQTQNGGILLTGGGAITNGILSSSAIFGLASGSISAILTGSGNVAQLSTGTVTLAGANTYSGWTIVANGAVVLSGAGTLGTINNMVAVGGGRLDLGGTTQT